MTDSAPTVAGTGSYSTRSAWISSLALGVAMVALAVAGVSLERSLHLPELPPPSAPNLALTRIDALRTRVRTLTDRMEALDTSLSALKEEKQEASAPSSKKAEMVGPVPPTTPPVATAEVEALKHEMTAVRAQMEATFKELQTALSDAQAKMENAKAEDVQALRRLGYQMLRAEVMQGRAYADALARYRALVSEETIVTKAFDVLETYADEGIATKATLYRELLALASESTEVAPDTAEPVEPPKDDGFWAQTKSGLSSLVRIERLSSAASPIAAQEEAQTTMALGDVARTRALLEALPEPEQLAYASWLTKARERERVMRALARVGAPVFAPVAASKPETGGAH